MVRENQDSSYTSASPSKSKQTLDREQRQRREREQELLATKENFVVARPLRQNFIAVNQTVEEPVRPEESAKKEIKQSMKTEGSKSSFVNSFRQRSEERARQRSQELPSNESPQSKH